ANMLQRAFFIIEPKQERADGVLAALVPAKSRHHTVAGADMLDLDHRALSRLIRSRRRLGDHAVQPRALEALQPVDGDLAVARHRREVERAPDLLEELLKSDTALLLWQVQQAPLINGQQIKRDKRSRTGLR